MGNNTCLGCLTTNKILKNNYCSKCIKELFNGIVPNPLNFDRVEFTKKRAELSPRMSISGVQDKISLTFEKKDLVPTAINGKYILKPISSGDGHIQNEKDVVANEHLSMLISKQIFKIQTANCGLIQFSDGELAYITKRFDYDDISGLKYDQEDFAGIMGITPSSHGENYKYDACSYLDCARMIKKYVASSIVSIEDFFKRVILNYLICNGDAHLKNFSLYSKSDSSEYFLTPNYDLLNTRFHINEKYGDMALELLDEYTPTYEKYGYYTYDDFKTFANYIDLKEVRFNKIMNFIEDSYPKVEELIDKSFLSESAKEFYRSSYKDRVKRLSFSKTLGK
ncbi:HipA domain-containing protein [Aliarcobacter butzleri]|uniref:type II toxin-antitoxin system HipA family toxin n=1 Tax=Aliarcobacter butzleri TaxID=28197 RepID=UPI00125F4730|nr:HipA domain-containing protein [Aliarcobacter butzleri]MCT7576763.1 HipA domain-containing protein [Aliarcobacter butzleri]MCT7578541.1 HipA domain-containing protein [Aliarcobacter butzleri]MCT7593050.1 HipA domain-containing protein [Aliarcobacter butzleri]MDK2063499.1 HipA domain-containing protein [Aliarcobacter butzleri]MDN5078547.1 HipA domain-containing protein [Aliarcobacter butzleri]